MSALSKFFIAILAVVVLGGGGYLIAKATESSTTTTTTTTTAASTTTTTTAQTAACRGGGLTGKFGPGQGAAGTIFMSVIVTNHGTVPCTLNGYPTMTFYDSSNHTMPSAVTPSGAYFSGSGGTPVTPSLITVAPQGTATFALAYSDVPAGSQTSCPEVDHISVYTPGFTSTVDAISIPGAGTFGPCGGGAVTVSPFYG